VSPMWNEDDHRALRELLAQDDKFRAEHAEWMARREPPASPPMRETDDAGDCDGGALAAAQEPEPDLFPEAVDEFSQPASNASTPSIASLPTCAISIPRSRRSG
jgi:hypothetical protein